MVKKSEGSGDARTDDFKGPFSPIRAFFAPRSRRLLLSSLARNYGYGLIVLAVCQYMLAAHRPAWWVTAGEVVASALLLTLSAFVTPPKE
jgi:hypothetical protein